MHLLVATCRAVLARRQCVPGLEAVSRVGRMQYQRPTDGVLAKQGALRSPQHLDTRQVHETVQVDGGAADVHLVNEPAYRLLNRVGRAWAKPPDIKVRQDGRAVDLEIGHIEREILHVSDSRCRHRVRADGADRDGNILDALGPLGGGDEHLFQLLCPATGRAASHYKGECRQTDRNAVANSSHFVYLRVIG